MPVGLKVCHTESYEIVSAISKRYCKLLKIIAINKTKSIYFKLFRLWHLKLER